VLFDPRLPTSVDVEVGLSDNGKLVVNSKREMVFKHESINVDATAIALKTLKATHINTVMIGAFAAATGLISLESAERGARIILAKFPEKALNLNLEAIRAGYEEVKHGKSIH
jgi:2-oxoacid:acceptor oxidoreductase gamma subunit (pyruvate/2-ketoisovalerate family)